MGKSGVSAIVLNDNLSSLYQQSKVLKNVFTIEINMRFLSSKFGTL